MDQIQVFEIDLPGTRRLKQARLESVLGAVPGNVTLVGMDFDRQNLDDILGSAGFQRGRRTVFIWEGVTQYITAEAVDETLEFVSSVSGVGSAVEDVGTAEYRELYLNPLGRELTVFDGERVAFAEVKA